MKLKEDRIRVTKQLKTMEGLKKALTLQVSTAAKWDCRR